MTTAVATARQPLPAPARPRGFDYGLLLALALGLGAAGPVIAATVHALSDGWLPAGDQANIATRAYDVFTSRSSLVGLHSDVSFVTNHAVYSLGPMLFWLLALPARLASPAAMTFTMGLVNSAAIVGVVVLARRRGGSALMFITAIALIVMSRSLAPEVLHDVWNPSAGIFPFTLLIFLCWSLACGEYRLLPLTVLVVSFVVQCQLAFVPPCAGLLLVGLVGLIVSLRSSATRSPAGSSRGSRRVWPWAVAALVVAAVCWAPPAIDQIKGRPGNLTAVVRTATANPPKLGATVGWHAVVRAIGVPPWWVRNPASPWQRKFEVRSATSTLAVVSTVLILAVLVAVAVIGVVRRRADLWAGALIALALCGGLMAVAASTPTKRVLAETLGYTMWWGSPAGMFVWVMLAWAATAMFSALALPRIRALSRGEGLPRRSASSRVPVAALASAGAVVAVAGAALAVSLAERPDYHLAEYRPLATMYAGLKRSVPAPRTVMLVGQLASSTFRFKMAARFALVRRGIRPLSPGIDVRNGSWYQLDHRPYDCAVYVKDGTTTPVHGATVVAAFAFREGAESHPVSVWVSPVGCPKRAIDGRAPAAGKNPASAPAATAPSPHSSSK